MKKIIAYFQFTDVTEAQYQAVWNDLRAAGMASPEGLLHHVGGMEGSNGCFVCDVWESAEAFQNFGSTLMPLLVKNGIPPVEPKILPVSYEYNKAEVLETA
jgi:hypothetical protein